MQGGDSVQAAAAAAATKAAVAAVAVVLFSSFMLWQRRDPRLDLLEFARGFEQKPPSWDMSNPIELWRGIVVDQEGDVIALRVDGARGEINTAMFQRLDEVFPHLQGLELKNHRLRGECCLDRLPRGLLQLAIDGSVEDILSATMYSPNITREQSLALKGGKHLVGTLSFAAMPSSLRHLSLTFCNLTNPPGRDDLDWECMAHLAQLQQIHLSASNHQGRFRPECLPRSVEWIVLTKNNFCGSAQWNLLPPSLSMLFIQECKFDGTLSLNALPQNLNIAMLDNNQNLLLVFDNEQHESLEWIHECAHFSCSGMKILEKNSGDALRSEDVFATQETVAHGPELDVREQREKPAQSSLCSAAEAVPRGEDDDEEPTVLSEVASSAPAVPPVSLRFIDQFAAAAAAAKRRAAPSEPSIYAQMDGGVAEGAAAAQQGNESDATSSSKEYRPLERTSSAAQGNAQEGNESDASTSQVFGPQE
jgi:hypothetical protein